MSCPQTPHTHPAELLFTEQGLDYHQQPDGTIVGLDSWLGRLLNEKDAIDTENGGRPVRHYLARIHEEPGGRFATTRQGSYRGGRRYNTFEDLAAAQASLAAWAGRRFRIPHAGR